VLTPLTRKPREIRYLTYDIEWYPESLEVRVVGLYDGQSYKPFYSVKDFLAFILTSRFAGARFYAHYGGRFDIVHLLPTLLEGGYKVELYLSGSSASRVIVSDGRHKWLLCDSKFLLADAAGNKGTALRSLGKLVGLEKGECAFDAPIAELVEYNRLDCIILYKVLTWVYDICLDLGCEFRFTLASLALDLFRRRFLKGKISTGEGVNSFASKAYTSSRVEVIRPVLHGGACFDVNSLFPAAMSCAPLPGNLIRVDRDIGDMTIAHCRVSVPDGYIPPTPVRYGASIFFPTGQWDGHYTTDDLQLLEDYGGRVVRVYEAHHFEKQTYLEDFVSVIFPLKKNALSPFERYFFKILLNALYGKFGEREEKETVILNPESTSCPHNGEHVVNGVSQCVRRISAGVFAFQERREVPHRHVPISAVITARGRAILHRKGATATNLAYWDCDSIWSNSEYEVSDELGDLKREPYDIERAVFLAPKAYAVYQKTGKPVVHVKGMRRLSIDEFESLSRGERLSGEMFAAPKTALRMKGARRIATVKGLSHVCSICQAFIDDECPDHPNDARVLRARLRPKRCVDHASNTSRPWTFTEITSKTR
jgi:hypothetical protein